ncbi:hypothetical protein CHISP_1380 [Chitinispirillum alkaliphilum]|nr:hypothetical protein CHISP_1380 [Chitinispirillum alkaliphilum]
MIHSRKKQKVSEIENRFTNVLGSCGGICIRVCFAFFTLLAVGALIYVGLNTLSRRQQENHRRAVRMSEVGLGRALQELGISVSWDEGIEKTYNDENEQEWYEVSVVRKETDDAQLLVIKSTGGMGSVQTVLERVFEVVTDEGDTLLRPYTN